MIKLVAALFLATLAGSATAAPADMANGVSVSLDECVVRSIKYLSGAPITKNIQDLVTAFHDTDEAWGEAVSGLDLKQGCEALLGYLKLFPAEVPCFEENNDEYRQDAIIGKIMSSEAKASLALQAGLACHDVATISRQAIEDEVDS